MLWYIPCQVKKHPLIFLLPCSTRGKKKSIQCSGKSKKQRLHRKKCRVRLGITDNPAWWDVGSHRVQRAEEWGQEGGQGSALRVLTVTIRTLGFILLAMESPRRLWSSEWWDHVCLDRFLTSLSSLLYGDCYIISLLSGNITTSRWAGPGLSEQWWWKEHVWFECHQEVEDIELGV